MRGRHVRWRRPAVGGGRDDVGPVRSTAFHRRVRRARRLWDPPSAGSSPVARVAVGLPGGDEILARPGDPGTDRADGALADVRRLGVGQAEHLGGDERLAALRGSGPAINWCRVTPSSAPAVIAPAASAAACQSGTDAILGRATAVRTWSTATRRAIVNTQVRADERPAKPGRLRNARRNVSWVRSSASPGPARCDRNRQTWSCRARMNAVAACRSPRPASRAHRVTWSSSATPFRTDHRPVCHGRSFMPRCRRRNAAGRPRTLVVAGRSGKVPEVPTFD